MSHGKKVVAYYTAWSTYGRNYQVTDIPANQITHINYAFANVANGQCVLGDSYADTDKFFPGDSWDAGAKRGNFNQLAKLKAQNPHLQTMISVGGWTWSQNFSAAAASDTSRKAFAKSCVTFMKTYGFDGIDIDWEYPVGGGLQAGKPEDKRNYTLLLQELEAEIKKQEAQDARQYHLSIAAPAGPAIVDNYEVANVANTLDWINIMTYDYNGSWNNFTGHNAPLQKSNVDNGPAGFYIDATVNNYLAKGAPAEKLVLGVPFYGRSWTGVANSNNGLHASATGAGPGTWEPGVLDYADIVGKYLSNPGYKQFRDPQSQVPYLYNPATGVFISFDDQTSMAAKTQYAANKGLGGAMLWDLSSDTRDDQLMNALNSGLKS